MMKAAARQNRKALINVILNVFSASMRAGFSPSAGGAGTSGCGDGLAVVWAILVVYLNVCT